MSKTASSELSPRETELLKLVATGATNQQIAAELHISINTVKAHLRNIFAKLEVESRTEATMVAMQRGLIVLSQADAQEPETDDAQSGDVHKNPPDPPPVWRMPWTQRLALIVVVAMAALVAVLPRAKTMSQSAASHLVDVAQDQQLVAVPADIKRWEPRAQLPTPRGRFALAMVDGRLYAMSGLTTQGWTGRVEAYDPAEDIWSRVAPKPHPVANVSAAVVDDRIMVPGGLLEDDTLTNIVEMYDPQRDTWSAGPELPEPLCGYAIETVEDDVYIFGGWDGDAYVDRVLRLGHGSETWEVVASMPAPAGFGAAATVDETIYLVGGWDGETVFGTCLSFSPDVALRGQDPWRTHSPMRFARAGHAAAVVDDDIYVIGGGWGHDVSSNESYDTGDDAWSGFGSPLTGQWRTMGAAAIATPRGDFLISVGGWQGQYLSLVETYQATFRVFLP